MIVENNKQNPYVISADVHDLLRKYFFSTGYSLPNEEFFQGLSDEMRSVLREYFGNVDVVSEVELKTGINKLAAESPYPIIAIDRVYLNRPEIRAYAGAIDMTRTVNEHFEDIEEVSPRPGYPPISKQLQYFKAEIPSPVTLIDDVIFSGKGILRLSQMLESVGRPVRQVICGIGIAEGVKGLEDVGINVRCIREYQDVIDEVCERDFYACVPFSGRTVVDKNGQNWSAPYFEPFGNPQKWASIPPEQIISFSEFCLSQSITLWRRIEQLSRERVPTHAVPRKIRGLKKDASVSRALTEHKLEICERSKT